MTVAVAPVFALGMAGQACFAGRIFWQWLQSERAHRCVVPRAFWVLGLAGAVLSLLYAALTRNGIYVAALLPGAFVSLDNLLLRRPSGARRLAPIAIALLGFAGYAALADPHYGAPLWTIVGVAGTLLWTGRFVLQWWISRRAGVPRLPMSFWLLSIAGSVLLLAFGVHLRDPVMVIAYLIGVVPYARNVVLLRTASGTRESAS